MPKRPFLIATTIDFPDDCQRIPFTQELLTQLLDRFQWLGVRRVYYNYYDNHQLDAAGQLQFHPGMAEEIRARIVQLGLG